MKIRMFVVTAAMLAAPLSGVWAEEAKKPAAPPIAEAELRSLYGELRDAASDGQKLGRIYRDRLDEGFVMDATAVLKLNGKEMPGQPNRQNKAEFIDHSVQGAEMTKQMRYSMDIKGMEIAKGGQTATVTTHEEMSGETAMPTPGQQSGQAPRLKVQGSNDCVNSLGRKGEKLVITGAKCTVRMSMSEAGAQR